MKQIDFQHRARRLRSLIGESTIADFAANIDRSPSQVSNILNGNKRLGEKLILHIEASLGLSPGFFDNDDADDSPLESLKRNYARAPEGTAKLLIERTAELAAQGKLQDTDAAAIFPLLDALSKKYGP